MAAFPTAHTLACLRIAGRVAASVARLATGWAGSPFAGRGSHPLDDKPSFMRTSRSSFLSDQPCLVALLGLSSRASVTIAKVTGAWSQAVSLLVT